MSFAHDQVFEKTDYTGNTGLLQEYEECSFVGCDFSGADLSGISFTGCRFTGCNLSMAKLVKTAFRKVQFTDCKMLGMRFDNCNDFLFVVGFESCVLHFASFYRVQLKKTKFVRCSLQEADLAEANLSEALFEDCDLALASFDNTNLEGADLRSAYNYSINPARNRVRKAKFATAGIRGLLDQYDIEIE